MDAPSTRPFSKVLIANRGEIAARIMRTCSEMGIATVAVYSDADATALHVRLAGESYHIGQAPATASYLDLRRIIEVARGSGAEAIHPGYGFLAENSLFAEACEAAGIAFVGPPDGAMRLLGSKRSAKALARRVGVPVVPGYEGEQQEATTLMDEAQRMGFPLLIKASAGGGGRGMRVVHSAAGFEEALEGAKREALSSFGDDTVLLERYVEDPRHIEFQVMADARGSVIHLGERECSVQRRHQKIIEESPSPALTPELRDRMGAAAVEIARAAGYVNAGTVEFMLSPTGEYYFLEVNTRLQVEHPVTEMVMGLDLVREQLQIAAGLPLSFTQEDVQPRGHAIECRVYAEDARNGFLPSTGRLLLFAPPQGPGVRNDSGVETGDEITSYYDPMLAKLIVHAPDRDTCVVRSLSALRAYSVLGVTTDLELLWAILASRDFRGGELSTGFLDRHLARFVARKDLPAEALLAAAGWQLTRPAPENLNPWRSGPWTASGQPCTRRYVYDDGEVLLTARRTGRGSWAVHLPSGERSIEVRRAGASSVLVREGAHAWSASVAESDGAVYVALNGESFVLHKAGGLDVDSVAQVAQAGHGQNALQAPMPGTIVKVGVREGDPVDAGQTLIVLEAMKMEHSIAAPHAGTVTRLPYSAGDLVQAGAVLAEVSE